jgi:autotransporter-associated beta strand protein
VFDDTATGTKNVNLTAPLKPSAVTVNSTADYTFSGAGKLSGPTGLTKSGSGMLTLLTNNDYAGATVVSGGTVRVGNGGTIGSLGTGNLSNSGTVIIDRSDDVTLSSNISGTGNLTKNGPGTLKLTGSYDQGGDTTIAGGTLELASGGTNSGRIVGPGALVKSGAGTLVLGGATTPGGGISITGGTLVAAADVAPGGTGTSVGGGATLQVGNGGTTGTLSGNVSLAAATTLAFNRSDASTFAGGISGDGRVTTVAGSGPVKLTGALSYTGTTDIGSARRGG